jgi:hypothetical protein
MISLSDGEIVWDPARGDFDWTRTDALPQLLRGKFLTEPVYVDFRSLKNSDERSAHATAFLDAVATVAARLCDEEKDVIFGADIRQLRKILSTRSDPVNGFQGLRVRLSFKPKPLASREGAPGELDRPSGFPFPL